MERKLRRSAILGAAPGGRPPGTSRAAFVALIAAGFLWGTTVPLSKVALEWLPPAWLTFARFAVAATVLLVAGRSKIKAAFSPSVLAAGAIGYGGSVLLQNAGLTRTSVSHAALLVGAVPVLVAIIAALWRRAVARPLAWAGFAMSLAGVGVVTSGGSGGSGGGTLAGDGLVLLSVLLSAGLVVAQTQLLTSRDPVAVTAVQFLGAAAAVLPVAAFTEGGVPPVPGNLGYLLATVALAAGGTLAPFTLFAYGQSRVPAEVAGAFVNIEPVVGAVAGVIIFGDPAGVAQVAGALAILAGIAMSSMPGVRRRQVAGAQPSSARSAAAGQLRPPRPQRPSMGKWFASSCCTTSQMILRHSTGTIARCTSRSRRSSPACAGTRSAGRLAGSAEVSRTTWWPSLTGTTWTRCGARSHHQKARRPPPTSPRSRATGSAA
jgi:O-acetylserine/cysteine efflux transporter